MTTRKVIYRSAITGRIITQRQAEQHPRTKKINRADHNNTSPPPEYRRVFHALLKLHHHPFVRRVCSGSCLSGIVLGAMKDQYVYDYECTICNRCFEFPDNAHKHLGHHWFTWLYEKLFGGPLIRPHWHYRGKE